jgi:hypothetical protein
MRGQVISAAGLGSGGRRVVGQSRPLSGLRAALVRAGALFPHISEMAELPYLRLRPLLASHNFPLHAERS